MCEHLERNYDLSLCIGNQLHRYDHDIADDDNDD